MMADENKREVSAEETRAAEEKRAAEHTRPAEHTQTTAEEPQIDYLEKAKVLADSYSLLIRRKAELEREIEESRSWFYTREDVIYKLSMGAHEQSERVQTSGTSNPVEHTVLNCDKVLASMNREIQNQRMELLIRPYRDVCTKIELFEIALRSLRDTTRLVAEQLFVQRRKLNEVCDAAGKPMSRRNVETERNRAFADMARVLKIMEGKI